jgi:cytoskeletal protein CcmA (bactofilin family)
MVEGCTMGWGAKREPSGLNANQIENVLGKSLHVRGDLKAQGAFRIDGTVDGSVASAGAVIIGDGGVVHGDVTGTDIVVAGHVVGNVTARGHLDIVSSGRVEGDINAKSFRMETGGVFRGTSQMGETVAEADAAAVSVSHLASIK